MKKKNTWINFGEEIEGYDLPVLNEREIRASAGILFLLLFAALMQVLFRQNFVPVKYVIVVFLSELLIRVFVNPKFAPLLIIARFVVRKQNPEYVGAPQKKFAWKIGLSLVSLMFIQLVVLNVYSTAASITCFICLSLLFFESSFGICLGCMVYGWFYKQEIQHCTGASCQFSNRDLGIKNPWTQLLILLCFIIFILVVSLLLKTRLTSSPKNLF